MADQTQPARETLVERAWALFASPPSIGFMLLVAGGIAVVSSVTGGGDVGWLAPVRPPYALPAVAGLVGGAFVLACGTFWDRWRRTFSSADAESSGWRGRILPALGLACVATGVALTVGSWFGVLRAEPPGELTISSGEKAQYFRGRVAGEPVKMMLPMRVHLERAERGPKPVFEVALSKAGGEPTRRATLRPGDEHRVGEYRIAPVGLTAEASALRVTISNRSDESIAATVGSGESFQLRPDGAKYEVEKITKNYLGSLGPAARVASPDHGTFWVFRRSGREEQPEFLHDLYVERIERAPAVLFSVSPAIPEWPLDLGGALLVTGFALVLLVPERVRVERDGNERPASFNDAGRLAGAVRDDGGA